jgi:hypothetical protein
MKGRTTMTTKTLGYLIGRMSEARRLGVLTDDEIKGCSPDVARMWEIREQLLNGFADDIFDGTIDLEACRKAMGDEPEFVNDLLDRIDSRSRR